MNCDIEFTSLVSEAGSCIRTVHVFAETRLSLKVKSKPAELITSFAHLMRCVEFVSSSDSYYFVFG